MNLTQKLKYLRDKHQSHGAVAKIVASQFENQPAPQAR
jgi:hypothetical protein